MKKEKKLLDDAQLEQAAGGVNRMMKKPSEADKEREKRIKKLDKRGWGDIF